MSGIKTVFVAGPTASGKTELAIRLARRFDGEIVSADSMQLYKGLHIASAAPDEAEKQGVPHHMLEFAEPEISFSAAEYVAAARECIADIHKRGRLPIVAGGTGLYISSLADNIYFTEEKTDFKLRAALEKRFESEGAEKMLERLSRFDPETAARLHPNDRRRIIRAFELYELTGKTATEQISLSHKGRELITPCIIFLTYRDRQRLYERINARVDKMLAAGLVAEAREALKRSGGGAVQAIGHKELKDYIDGSETLEAATERLKRQTRRYAKRQLTWFNREERMHRIYADEVSDTFDEAAEIVAEFTEKEERP